MKVRQVTSVDVPWIKKVFVREWGGEFVVTRGKIHKPEDLEGFIAEIGNKKVGLVTYKIQDNELEIISLNSFLQRHGVGTALVSKVIEAARGLRRVYVITVNDNMTALRFYQKRGFHLVRVYPDAIEQSRKLKPGIPLIGIDDIPLRDEIELDMMV